MAFVNKKALWVAAGVLSGFGTAYCVSELRRRLREKCTREPLSRLEDTIRLEDLEILTQSSNISLKRSAEQLLLDRAMRKKNLCFIMAACRSEDEIQVLKGVTVLGVLVKSPEFRERLVQNGVLETLAICLEHSYSPGYKTLAQMGGLDVHLQKLASASLFDLLCDEDANKIRLVQAHPSVIEAILQLMAKTKSKEVMRWCLFDAHQLTLCDSIRSDLIANSAVRVVSELLVRNLGDGILMRLCLQMLVTFANGSDQDEVEILKVIGEYDVFVPTVVSLRAEDNDLVYWSAALLHEFAIKDLCKPSICATPNIIKSLHVVLSASESVLQRIVLRILSFLCVGNQSFRSAVLESASLLARLPVCFASGDKDVVHWAVVLLHDLLLSAGNSVSSKTVADKVIAAAPEIIRTLIPLAFRKENLLIRLVAENLGFFCAIDSLQYRILEDRVLKAVLMFAVSDDTDLQYWSTALLLNMSMMSDEVKEEIIRLGGIKPLIELAISDSEQPQIAAQAAKTLVMLGFIDKHIPISLKSAGCQKGDLASIKIDDKEYCVNRRGINIVVLDFLTFKVTESTAFDTGRDVTVTALLVEFIQMIPQAALVLVAVKGEASYFITAEAKEAFREIGIEDSEFKPGELWVYFGQKKRDTGEQLAINRGFEQVSLQTSLWLGRLVKGQVQVNILLPVIDVLMSTPASVAISKASELELLTILARHAEHKQVMVSVPDLLQYMAELVWSMSVLTADQLRANPLALAHCIGAVKIVTAISISEQHHDNLAQAGVLSAVLALLYRMSDVTIKRIEKQTAQRTAVFTDGEGEGEDHDGAHGVTDLETPIQDISALPEKVELTASGLRSPVGTQLDQEVSFDERKPPTPRGPSAGNRASGHDEFEDTFSSLTCLAITTLYNCTSLFSGHEDSRETLLRSGALQVLWCSLFTSNKATVKRICLPIEALLNTFGCFSMLEKYYPEHVMELDERVKTPALLLSADRLEANNTNWTFESVRTTFCIGRTMYHAPPFPAGWYYEVTLKSNGILQIGWQTDDCRYGPEKGVGVGDNNNSCAFDGARCKVWSGPPNEQQNNDYGVEWSVDDVLSCLFSWNGDVSFWINGANMGVAFQEMNSGVNWYPAASLAMDQHCCFNFGSKPFRYEIPDGYVAVSHVVTNSAKKLPMRLSACWTPVSGSFDSIVEEDEESDEDLEPEESGKTKLPENNPVSVEASLPVEREEKAPIMREEEEPQLDAVFDLAGTPKSSYSQTFDSFTTVTPNSTFQDTPDRRVILEEERPRDAYKEIVGESKATSTPFAAVPPAQASLFVTSVVPFSPGESLANSSGAPSMPCLYFEAELKSSPSRIKQMGFFDVDTKEKIFCDIHDGQLLLPLSPYTDPSPMQKECHRAPDVVGCGIMWPAGVVIFTIDGVGTGNFYQFPSDKPLVIQNMLPYVSCSRIRCNYGQRPFLFEDANLQEVRFAAASVLHEHEVSNEAKFHEESAR